MGSRRRRRKSHRETITSELELMPMLNVFIAIIPLLLLSAAFVPVSVIRTSLNADAEAAAEAPEDVPLDLAIYIHPEAYLVEVNGAITRTIPRGSPADAARARAQLGDALEEIAAAHPDRRDVRIVSRPNTRYEEVIDVMDVARAAGMPEAGLAEAGPEAP